MLFNYFHVLSYWGPSCQTEIGTRSSLKIGLVVILHCKIIKYNHKCLYTIKGIKIINTPLSKKIINIPGEEVSKKFGIPLEWASTTIDAEVWKNEEML